MPPVSGPQSRAMYAAASGQSTLGIPASVGKEFIGEAVPKKKARRGKPKGKPGSQHLENLKAAHGAGDFASARTHALNYAKATMVGLGTPNTQTFASGPSATEPDPDDAGPSAGPVVTGDQTVAQTVPNPRAKLAAMAMRMRAKK